MHVGRKVCVCGCLVCQEEGEEVRMLLDDKVAISSLSGKGRLLCTETILHVNILVCV